MLPAAQLHLTLANLHNRYEDPAAIDWERDMFAKMGLIELCGWIEQTQDALVDDCISNSIVSDKLKKLVGQRVKNNYGFHFEEHFCPLLLLAMGAEALGWVLGRYERGHPAVLATFINHLNSLKDPRNRHAHTHFDSANPTLPTLDSTSVLRTKATDLERGFSLLEFYIAKK